MQLTYEEFLAGNYNDGARKLVLTTSAPKRNTSTDVFMKNNLNSLKELETKDYFAAYPPNLEALKICLKDCPSNC